MSKTILEVKDLKKHFPIEKGMFQQSKATVKAVNGVSFSINEGETFGLVGESGSGKTTTGRLIMRLLDPTAGSIVFNGKDITTNSESQLRSIRKDFQMIFQDPYASLNPRMTIKEIVEEPMVVHHMYDSRERSKRVEKLLETVGLSAQHGHRYPHEFSGGQRQRVGIARALAVNPKLIIADEAVSALDVSIQSQILNLMKDLQKEYNLTYLFIAHDLSVVDYISDRIGVMYLGKMVEVADKKTLINDPKHPYTKALLSAVPVPDPRIKKERIFLNGEIPSPSNPPSGCPFHTRCPIKVDKCEKVVPELLQKENGQLAACHLAD